MLPHGYPFRFVDRREDASEVDGGVRVQVSAGAFWVRGADELPPFLGVEIMAQAAMALLEGPAGGSASDERPRGRLAGVESATFHAPLRPGDELLTRARLVGRYGSVVKAAGTIERRGQTVAECQLLLASEG